VKGRFDRQITHAPGVPVHGPAEADVSDKPKNIRKWREMVPVEKTELRDVARQRAESIYAWDVEFGKIVQRLKRTGEYDNTVIVFTSDNGYYLGEHRKREGKINLHEPSLRVPLLVTGPGVPTGRRYDPVSTVDLAPTLASYAGTRMPGADGTDLTRLVTRGDRGWDRPVVTEGRMPEGLYVVRHRMGPSPLNTRGLRLGRWKVTRYSTGETELYDLQADPLELDNLARVPRFADVRADLLALLADYRDCAGAECRRPLPAQYRLDPDQVRQVTDAEVARTNAWFGN
jgi:arylsulfatase A-like enzyme